MSKEKFSVKHNDYIVPLYKIITRFNDVDRVGEWLAENGERYSNAVIKKTFKMAGRDDLSELFLKEEDISVGDRIKSRMTSREGRVVAIHWDGDTIEVKWNSGGRQLLSKESVFKISDREISKPSDVVKVKTKLDSYSDMDKEDKSPPNSKKEASDEVSELAQDAPAVDILGKYSNIVEEICSKYGIDSSAKYELKHAINQMAHDMVIYGIDTYSKGLNTIK